MSHSKTEQTKNESCFHLTAMCFTCNILIIIKHNYINYIKKTSLCTNFYVDIVLTAVCTLKFLSISILGLHYTWTIRLSTPRREYNVPSNPFSLFSVAFFLTFAFSFSWPAFLKLIQLIDRFIFIKHSFIICDFSQLALVSV